ncbi:MAG: hypothetical protein IKL87_08125 [Oscillospiraceae bacterium]|nr:hypothetical protein [Oscillospiraceae bacterium]
MAKNPTCWTVTVGEDVIRVVNGEGLYVNDKLQDVTYGIATCEKFYGKLSDGKEVKAVIGAKDFGLKIHCTIFVDCECVFND